MNEPFLLQRQPTTASEFVACWSTHYHDPREDLYTANVGRPYEPAQIVALFEWKNGGVLSARKRYSVDRNFVGRLDEFEAFELDSAEAFLRTFAGGGAIWRIFWLHLWQPDRFPIYDQHVHRAMTWIKDGEGQEIPSRDGHKIRAYLEDYLPFYRAFGDYPNRDLDKALWTCGKLMKPLADVARWQELNGREA